jgi:hypothetical protein
VLSVSLKTDKTEYRTVIKFFVKEGLTPNEFHSKFIKVYVACSPSFQQLRSGLPSLNVAVTTLKMIHVKGLKKVQKQHQKSLMNHSCYKLNSMALVRERTIPTEQPPPFGEVSAKFCG